MMWNLASSQDFRIDIGNVDAAHYLGHMDDNLDLADSIMENDEPVDRSTIHVTEDMVREALTTRVFQCHVLLRSDHVRMQLLVPQMLQHQDMHRPLNKQFLDLHLRMRGLIEILDDQLEDLDMQRGDFQINVDDVEEVMDRGWQQRLLWIEKEDRALERERQRLRNRPPPPLA